MNDTDTQRKLVSLSNSSKRDLVPTLRETINQYKDNLTIRFPKDTYYISDETASKHFLYISNNDSGIKSIAIHVKNRHSLTIDGQGSTLLVKGKVIPILIENCQNITLRNFIIDWETDYHAELVVEKSNATGTTFRILNNCATHFMEGRVYFDNYPDSISVAQYHLHLLEYDTKMLTPAKNADDFFLKSEYHIESLSEHTFRVDGLVGNSFQPGKLFIATNHVRPAPGIVISNSSNVTVEDVTVHYALGIAILAQHSAHVELNHVTVKRSDPRRISTLADASHFVMCKGHIYLNECDFSGQLDDATNVHGIYGVIDKILDNHTIVVALQHYQQLGTLLGNALDNVRFLRFPEHLSLGENQITHIRSINDRYQHIVFVDPIPTDLVAGDILENLTLYPDLTIDGCHFVDNRARGILITTPGKVLVIGTTFHNPGSAIRISGDVIDWFEAGATKSIEIVGNQFLNCNYGSSAWGKATIDVYPAFDMPEGHQYHQNVVIRDNQFKTSHALLLQAKNVGRIEFVNNSILRSGLHTVPESNNDYCILDNVNENIVMGNTESLAKSS